MIDFRDFVPQRKEPGGFFQPATHEQLSVALARANAWIGKQSIEVVNVETVVLPNMHLRHEDGPEDVELRTGEGAYWNQFIRVWFRPAPA